MRTFPSPDETTEPTVPAPAPAIAGRPRRDLRPMAVWLAGGAAYAALGAWQPAVFLLGFWQSSPMVLLLTWIAARVVARGPRT